MLNVYAYIDSQAIAEHLKKMHYGFSSEEAAYLIYHSKKRSLAEKKNALIKLVNEWDDVSLPKEIFSTGSLKKEINAYLRLEEEILLEFYQKEEGAMYTYSIESNGCRRSSTRFFPDYSSCYDHAMACEEQEDCRIKITKRWLNEESTAIWLWLDGTGKPYDWDCVGPFTHNEKVGVFDSLRCTLPLPFQKGDILTTGKKNFVFEQTFLKEQVEEKDRSAYNDKNPCIVCGTFVTQEGSFCQFTTCDWLSLEYYYPKNEGVERLLLALAKFKEGRLSVEDLLRTYTIVLCERFADEEKAQLNASEEIKKMIGVADETDAFFDE